MIPRRRWHPPIKIGTVVPFGIPQSFMYVCVIESTSQAGAVDYRRDSKLLEQTSREEPSDYTADIFIY